jgi:hypothetical protein
MNWWVAQEDNLDFSTSAYLARGAFRSTPFRRLGSCHTISLSFPFFYRGFLDPFLHLTGHSLQRMDKNALHPAQRILKTFSDTFYRAGLEDGFELDTL